LSHFLCRCAVGISGDILTFHNFWCRWHLDISIPPSSEPPPAGRCSYSINILGPHSICNEQESDDGFAMVFKVNQNEKKMYESWILYPMLPKKTVCNFSYCDLTLSDLIIPNTISYMGVSKNRGTTIFGNIHMYIYTYVCIHIYLVLDQISNVLPAFCIFFWNRCH